MSNALEAEEAKWFKYEIKRLVVSCKEDLYYFLWLDDLAKQEGVSMLELELCAEEQI